MRDTLRRILCDHAIYQLVNRFAILGYISSAEQKYVFKNYAV